MVVEVGALAEQFAAEAPSVVASEAGITEAAVTTMEAVTGGRASTLAGVIRIGVIPTIGVIRIMVIPIIRVIRTITGTRIMILTRMAVRITRRHRRLNRHGVRVNLHHRNQRPRNSLRIRRRCAVVAWNRGNSESGAS